MAVVNKQIQEKKLLQIRDRIAQIDTSLLSTIKKRMILAIRIGQIKRKLDLNILDKRQEKKVKDRYLKLAKKNGLEEKFVETLCKSILRESKRLQKNKNK